MSVIGYVEAHPYQTGGIVFGIGVIGLIVWKLSRPGSSASTPQVVQQISGDALGYSAAAQAANAQIQVAATQASAHSADVQAQLQGHMDDNALQASIAGLHVTDNANQLATAFQIANVNSTTQVAGINADRDVKLASIAANTTNLATASAADLAFKTASIAADQAVAMGSQNTQVQVAQIGANVQTQQITASQDVANHTLNNQLALGTQQESDSYNLAANQQAANFQTGLQSLNDQLQLGLGNIDTNNRQIDSNIQIANIQAPVEMQQILNANDLQKQLMAQNYSLAVGNQFTQQKAISAQAKAVSGAQGTSSTNQALSTVASLAPLLLAL